MVKELPRRFDVYEDHIKQVAPSGSQCWKHNGYIMPYPLCLSNNVRPMVIMGKRRERVLREKRQTRLKYYGCFSAVSCHAASPSNTEPPLLTTAYPQSLLVKCRQGYETVNKSTNYVSRCLSSGQFSLLEPCQGNHLIPAIHVSMFAA